MKIRQGFVSNSSTTSFTCDVCSRTEAYHDSISYTDLDFFMCENGHGVCEEHRLEYELTLEKKRDLLLAYYEQWNDSAEEICVLSKLQNDELAGFFDGIGDDWWQELICDQGEPEEFCPICQFLEVGNADFCKHLEKKTGITRDEIFVQVKAQNKRRRKLYDTEYVTLVCMQTGTDVSAELASLKEQYGTYKAFLAAVK